MYCRHCAALRLERDELAERVRQLEAMLSDSWVPADWRLSPIQSAILALLSARRGATTTAMLHYALYAADPNGGADIDAVRAHVHELRQKVLHHNVAIRSARGVGYWLDDRSRSLIESLQTASA